MKMIKLTHEDGGDVFVNSKLIGSFWEVTTTHTTMKTVATLIISGRHDLHVKETPAQILALIEEASK